MLSSASVSGRDIVAHHVSAAVGAQRGVRCSQSRKVVNIATGEISWNLNYACVALYIMLGAAAGGGGGTGWSGQRNTHDSHVHVTGDAPGGARASDASSVKLVITWWHGCGRLFLASFARAAAWTRSPAGYLNEVWLRARCAAGEGGVSDVRLYTFDAVLKGCSVRLSIKSIRLRASHHHHHHTQSPASQLHAITHDARTRTHTHHTHTAHVPTLRVSRRRLGVVARALPSAPCPVAAATRGAALPRTAPPCRSRRGTRTRTRTLVASSPHRGRGSRKSGVQHFRQVFMVRQG